LHVLSVSPIIPIDRRWEVRTRLNSCPARDRLILKALARESMHGYGIAQHLRIVSEDVLQVGRARFYTLTPAGRRQAALERREFDRMVLAINRVLLNFAK
jgi:DNA-binding PadR family transcriptional regulator